MANVAYLLSAIAISIAAVLVVSFLVQRKPEQQFGPLFAGIVLAFGPFCIGYVIYFIHPDAAMTLSMFMGPVLIVGGLIAGIYLARAQISRHWAKALCIAVAGLAGHFYIAWPQMYYPYYAEGFSRAYSDWAYHNEARKAAIPVLREYGLVLPGKFTVIYSKIYKTSASFSYPQARIVIATNYRLEHEVERELISWVKSCGYREADPVERMNLGDNHFIKEPFTVMVGGGSQHRSEPGVELLLAKDESGRFLSRLFSNWKTADGEIDDE